MTPYRLISTQEIKRLHQQLSIPVERWAADFCIDPPHIELGKPSNACMEKEVLGIYLDNNLMAISTSPLFSKLNVLLFGMDEDAFTVCSQKLAALLFQTLFAFPNAVCDLRPIAQPLWYYPGSTSLQLHIANLEFLLSPDFIYSQLPEPKVSKTALKPSTELLDNEILKLSVEIEVPRISLQDLLHMQPGDLLTTEHLLSAAIPLKHGAKAIAETEPGKINHTKSIQIKRFL